MTENRYLAEPNPEWVDFPNNLPSGTPHFWMNRERKPIHPDPTLEITEFEVPAHDSTSIRLRSYRSKSAEGPLPLFIYMHGGGFVTGSLETDDTTCRAWAKALKLVVLSIEYRLAPEHPFPIGFEDCWDILTWSTSPAAGEQLRVDITKGFLLGGTSAGGNFTAGLAHRYQDEHLSPPLTGLVFLASSFCHPDVRPSQYRDRILSVDEIDSAPGLTKSSIEYFWKKYGAPKDDKRYSPLLYKEWKGIATKAYFSICGWDPRRDEALVFADILEKEGLGVNKDVYSGLPHGFWTTCPSLPVSRKWEDDVVNAVRLMLKADT